MIHIGPNLGLIHPQESEWKAVKWQLENECTVISPSDHVKASFCDAVFTEHMWVLVQYVDGDCIIGTLDNDPVTLTLIKCGDRVDLQRKDVIDHMRNNSSS